MPAYPFDVFPYVVAGWLAVGLAIAFLVPGFAGRVDRELHSRTEVDGADATAASPVLQL